MEDPNANMEVTIPLLREGSLPSKKSEEPFVNLLGHCPFCLTKVTDVGVEGKCKGTSPRTGLSSLNFLWTYLRFGEKIMSSSWNNDIIPNFVFLNDIGGGPVKETVPSMCKVCFEEVKTLKGVHEQLTMIRNTVKAHVKRLHKIILATENGKALTDTGRWKFERELRRKANPTLVEDTLTFLEFIKLGMNKEEIAKEQEVEDIESRNSRSGPLYPLTSCELLVPVRSPSSLSHASKEALSGRESFSDTEDNEANMENDDIFQPEVKIELPSDEEEDVDNFQSPPEDITFEERHSTRPRKQNICTSRSRRKIRNIYQTEFSNSDSSDSEDEKSRRKSLSQRTYDTTEGEQDDDSDKSDSEFAMDDETMMDATSDSENSDASILEKDPLSELTRKKKEGNASSPKQMPKNKGSDSQTSQNHSPVKRGRGRPRKSERGEPSKTFSVAPKTPVILQKAPGQHSSRTYLCDVCQDPPLTFTSEKGLIRHKVEKHGVEPLRCKTCNEIFYTPRSLFCHEKREHPETTPDRARYFCDICNKSFCSRFYVEHHKKTIHFKEKPYSCNHCDKQFTNQLGRDLHIKAFHLKEEYECSACHKTFKFKHLFERHRERRHPNMLEVVGRLFTREERNCEENKKNENNENESSSDESEKNQASKMKLSFNRPRRGRPRKCANPKFFAEFKCNLCPDLDRLFTETGLKVHKHREHGEKFDSSVTCRLCKQTLPTARALQYHQKTYHPHEKPDPVEIPCLECDKTFTQIFVLRTHQRVVHRKEKLFECKECPKSFENRVGLTFHMQAIHLGKRYYCDICNKEFKYPTGIKRHKIEVHKIEFKGTKPRKPTIFTCTECEPPETAPTFMKEDSFDHHMIIFHGADPHSCPHCVAKFPWKKQLNNHIKNVHGKGNETDQDKIKKPKEKPIFTCEHCGKIYLNKDNLKIHLTKIHDPDWPKKAEPYVCQICGKSYIHKSGYKSHLKMQHRSKTQHICHVCGMNFRNPYYLAKHMQNHTLLRTHHCPHCPARFKRKDTCQKHIRFVHNRVKQRNVGIRRMHFRHLDDDVPNTDPTMPSTATVGTLPQIPGMPTTPKITNTNEALPATSTGYLNLIPEVKVDTIKESTSTTGSSGNFQNIYGYGFMNL